MKATTTNFSYRDFAPESDQVIVGLYNVEEKTKYARVYKSGMLMTKAFKPNVPIESELNFSRLAHGLWGSGEMTVRKCYAGVAAFAFYVMNTKWFRVINFCGILLAAIAASLQAEGYQIKVGCPSIYAPIGTCATSGSQFPNWAANGTIAALQGHEQQFYDEMDVMNDIAWGIFFVEFVVKVLAEGSRPWSYFFSLWNMFDFLILVISSSAVEQSPAVEGLSWLTGLRSVRVVKVLGMVKEHKAMCSIMAALDAAVKSLTYIGPLWMLLVYIFASFGCAVFSENDPDKFGRLHWGVLTLIQVSTMDGLGDVMATAVYGCEIFPPTRTARTFRERGIPTVDPLNLDEVCVSTPSYFVGFFFFFVYTILSGFILLSAFLGIVQIAMDTSNEEQTRAQDQRTKIERFSRTYAKSPMLRKRITMYCKAFKYMDVDRSGYLSAEEVQLALAAANIGADLLSPKEVEAFLHDLADKAAGEVGMDEFVVFMFTSQRRVDSGQCDSESSDPITADKLDSILAQRQLTPKDVMASPSTYGRQVVGEAFFDQCGAEVTDALDRGVGESPAGRRSPGGGGHLTQLPPPSAPA